MKVMVLGAGMVGGVIARDLSMDNKFEVTVADINQAALDRLKEKVDIKLQCCDLSDVNKVSALIAGYDCVVDATPSVIGYQTLRTAIQAGINIVSISFFTEDPFSLDQLAKEKNVVAIMDAGVAPGMTNILIGHAAEKLDSVDSVVTYVGGLPKIRQWPWEYKAGFSPFDVIEEYTRPVCIMENGRLITKPALSDPELIDFAGVGTLEAFNTDGVRTLAQTIKALNIKEKTLRYPGHIEKIAVLRECGFFQQTAIEINNMKIKPIDMTARLLFPMWKMGPQDRDITVAQVNVEGLRNGKPCKYSYDLLDHFDESSGVSSMARTTGYTASMIVRLLAEGLYQYKGISPPEYLGRDEKVVEFLLAGLATRGVHYHKHSLE